MFDIPARYALAQAFTLLFIDWLAALTPGVAKEPVLELPFTVEAPDIEVL